MDYQNLDLIDLISERHLYLRACIEKRWNEVYAIHISLTEWHILTRLTSGYTTAASMTKSINLTRQAIHKVLKNMEQKSLIEIYDAENNKKEKCIRLTPFGEQCFRQYTEIKIQLESEISIGISEKQLQKVKEILRQEWHVQSSSNK